MSDTQKNSRTKILQVRVTPKEMEMIKALSSEFGDISNSDAVRRCIQERFTKAFPAYKKNKNITYMGIPEKDMTKEQICEALGGKVSRNDSGPICLVPIGGGSEMSAPLSMMGEGNYKLK